MDAAETDIAMSKYVKIICQVESWSLSCSMEEVNYTKIITRFPKYIPKREKEEKKDKVCGSLVILRQLPSLSCFAMCWETVITK